MWLGVPCVRWVAAPFMTGGLLGFDDGAIVAACLELYAEGTIRPQTSTRFCIWAVLLGLALYSREVLCW